MYDFVNYHREALVTEAPITKEVEFRLLQMWPLLEDVFEEMIELSSMIDRIKRVIYYNKPDEDLQSQVAPMLPTGDKRERITQLARFFHAMLIDMGECGEICEPIRKLVNGEISEADVVNLKEEVGDKLWALNLMAAFLNTDLIAIGEANKSKLRQRYPNRFTEYDANNRNLDKERAVLESHS